MTKLLALTGSLRAESTNTALLRALTDAAPPHMSVSVYAGLAELPIFSPDREGPATPEPVLRFADAVRLADGIVVSCPEYVHALPGGFKNAIDWLVSRDEVIDKPIALLHASHRGDDVLRDLRRVLGTVSTRFNEQIFARFDLMKRNPDEIAAQMREPEKREALQAFLSAFEAFILQSAVTTGRGAA